MGGNELVDYIRKGLDKGVKPKDLKEALSEDGIAVTQCESFYFHRPVIEGVAAFAQKLYPKTGYYYTLVPAYPSGVIGFFFCSLRYDPVKDLCEERAAKIGNLRYYTPETHRSAFTLPRFAQDIFIRKKEG
jgi:spermidine synthase